MSDYVKFTIKDWNEVSNFILYNYGIPFNYIPDHEINYVETDFILRWSITFEEFCHAIHTDIEETYFEEKVLKPLKKKSNLSDEEFDETLKIALKTMYLAMYFIEYDPIIDNDTYEAECKSKIKEDLLKLYVHCHSSEWRKSKRKNEEEQRAKDRIKIFYNNGNNEILLDNEMNWFFDKFIKRNIGEFLPDIKNVEDAKKALELLKPKSGRKIQFPHKDAILYGTYLTLQKCFKLKGKSAPILSFIGKYIAYIMKDKGIEVIPDNELIKSNIYYIEKEYNIKDNIENKPLYARIKTVDTSELEYEGRAYLFLE